MGLQVSIGGTVVSGLIQATVTNNNYFSSDSFSLTFAINTDGSTDLTNLLQSPKGYIEIKCSDPSCPSSFSMITGSADSLVADPILRTVSLEGRDLSASLIDSYLQQDFVNQSASEIVQTIALQHGLLPQVTSTFGNIGRYFGDGYTKLSLGQFSKLRSNWDLVVQLAREQDFDVFVQGQCLVFQPAISTMDLPVQITPADVTTMRLERNLTLNTPATIKVQSWNSDKCESYTTDASNSTISELTGTSTPSGQTYLFSSSNLTSSQVDLRSLQYSSELARLRSVLHVDMPWDMRITPRTLIFLQGAGLEFDGLYRVDSVERRYNTITGSTQAFRAISWPVLNQASAD